MNGRRKRPAKVDRSLHAQLIERGWSYARAAGSGHLVYSHPQASSSLVVSASPSDNRATANTLADADRLTGGRQASPPPSGGRRQAALAETARQAAALDRLIAEQAALRPSPPEALPQVPTEAPRQIRERPPAWERGMGTEAAENLRANIERRSRWPLAEAAAQVRAGYSFTTVSQRTGWQARDIADELRRTGGLNNNT